MTKETSTRVLTGVVGGLGLLLLIIFAGHIGVSFLAAGIGGVMCWELSHVFFTLSDKKEKLFALIGTLWLVIFINILLPKTSLECLVVAFMGMFTYYLSTAERHGREKLKQHLLEFIYTVFTLVYVATFLSFLPLIRGGVNGMHWTILFLLINWSGDTAAYFFGKKYGKHKLYPLISPGKTVEGAGAAIVCSILITLIYKLTLFKALGFIGVIVVPVAVSIVSQIGDLCESFLKRSFEMKDTGHLLPGHGGFLDRFDGVLFSLPLMYTLIRAFG